MKIENLYLLLYIKLMSYFDALPIELLEQLTLYLHPIELFYFFYHKIYNVFDRLLSINKSITSQELWRRNISSIIQAPNVTYKVYVDIFHGYLQGCRDTKIGYTAQNSYDVLLYPLLIEIGDFLTAMYTAAYAGQDILIEKLLEIYKNKFGETNLDSEYENIMQLASQNGHINIIRRMLEKGATNYNDAMASAAEGGQIEIVKLMLEKGATAYDDARFLARKHHEIIELLRNYPIGN